MAEQSIEIIIAEDGKVEIETQGFVGKECHDIAKKIKDAIGTVQSEALKPEYFKKQNIKNTLDFSR